jgi:hypothetical protein
MKNSSIITTIAVFLSICLNGLQAQTTLPKLNQVELIKQFISNWKGEVGKDTTAFWEIKSNGTGLECNYRYVTKDRMIMEGKQLWVYDKKVDKFILSSATNGMDAGTSGLWFTSKNKCIIIAFRDISNPEKASFKMETEFKSPDMFIQKTIVNNNILKTVTYNRVKN